MPPSQSEPALLQATPTSKESGLALVESSSVKKASEEKDQHCGGTAEPVEQITVAEAPIVVEAALAATQ